MESGNQKSGEYAAMSQRCIGEADNYLRRRRNNPASGMGWEATVQALKAIAARRGWSHDSPKLIIDIATQVADEQGCPDLIEMFGVALALQTNFYENWLHSDTIEIYLNEVKKLLPELERIRTEPSPAFTPKTGDQRNRWRRLTRAGQIRPPPPKFRP